MENLTTLGGAFCQQRYDTLTRALREKDLLIVRLQQECSEKEMRLNNLEKFESMLVAFQQFFALMLSQNKKLN